MFGAPLAWIAQISLSEPIAAHACYPYQAPLPQPIWTQLPFVLAAISLACLAAALLSCFMVWTSWRRLKAESGCGDKPVLDAVWHRQIFFLNLGALSSFLFTLAIVFNICAVWLVSPCSPWF
ncbi:MAG: hypothetical protein ACXWEU_09410 [Methylomonas sp.]